MVIPTILCGSRWKQGVQDFITYTGNLRNESLDRLPIVKAQPRSDVIELPRVLAKRDLEVSETARLPRSIASRIEHRVSRVRNCHTIFVKALFHPFEVPDADRVAHEADQQVGYSDLKSRPADGIGGPFESEPFFVQPPEAFVAGFGKNVGTA